MLKPRYQTLAESVGDFNRMLSGMNKIQPLERGFDEDLLDIIRNEQELARLEAQIEHAHRVASGSGQQISQTESNSLAQMHGHAASMYSDAATKAAEKVRKYISTQNPAMVAKMKDVTKRLKMKAQEHASLSKRHSEEESMVAESVAQSRSPIMRNFRVLAGIDQTEMMPRDPGVLGTTRFNAGYHAMAEAKADVKPFVEAKHEPKAEPIQESDKWAADAVKRPGRLHKYFGIPEGQKIPMSKIKGAYEKLKGKDNKSAEETSLMRALALGIRFKGGDVPGGEKKKGLGGEKDEGDY